ncbi:Hydrogenase isoenzymes nickel incorporation protein HypB [Planctomycetes bacterium Pan216]|uniref:Hydrogenase isoenzymes nickel incorporation protein HypB n=1 Tax=Kolteria novifilia TaxID=2527975 RepID=A0A518BBU3_9BACT|nr:Hydrogenase isoenzymes nickel incorporation protein HypB [Planctomycetes bacterium Pan216]
MKPRILEVRTKILKHNDEIAREMRSDFARRGLFVVNLVSSPGAGKTELLTHTLSRLGRDYRIAAVVGDLATENDARRIATSGAPTKQIETGNICHLEADMVSGAIADWNLDEFDFLFIENVGNLVCPTSFDLGEHLRVLLLSVTEGEDKPLKYPTLINTADVTLITKIDIAEAVGFDADQMKANIQSARPGITMLDVASKRGDGMEAWIDFLVERRAAFLTDDNAVSSARS